MCYVASWWNIPVCPNIILSATLFQLLCILLRVLIALLVCTARPFLSSHISDGVMMKGLGVGGGDIHAASSYCLYVF
jgi:hypothetical protein